MTKKKLFRNIIISMFLFSVIIVIQGANYFSKYIFYSVAFLFLYIFLFRVVAPVFSTVTFVQNTNHEKFYSYQFVKKYFLIEDW